MSMQKIPFHIPFVSGDEKTHVNAVVDQRFMSGDGIYGHKAIDLLARITQAQKVLLTPSCTAALEMAALLLGIQPGDEVIMPSFAHSSTANAFVLRGARIMFVDIRPDTMNLDENELEQAINAKTRCIVVIHYAGVACAMDQIMALANKHQIWVVEDAAHGIGAYYKNRHLGTIGHLGALSFHDTKNVHCGEGGALLINDPAFNSRAEIIREKGTDRMAFQRSEVDFYHWKDLGSSYLLSELNAAFLYAQLMHLDQVNVKRRLIWTHYQLALQELETEGFFLIAKIPTFCQANGHIFYLKCNLPEDRSRLAEFLAQKGIAAYFHYIPLHSAPAGKKWGRFIGDDVYTTKGSDCLLRLPLYYDLEMEQVNYVIETIQSFYKKR